MDAIVPAAGQGTRLRPLTADRPKPMVSVAGRPLLQHVFDALAPAEPDRYVVVVGYEGETIREHFGASYRGVPIEYVRQDRQLGLAHAVRLAADVVEGSCLVCNGDNVFAGSLAPLQATHAERVAAGGASDYAATMLVERASRERASRVGAVVTERDDATTPSEGDASADGAEAPTDGAQTPVDAADAPTDDAAPANCPDVPADAETVTRVVEKADDPPSTLVSAGAYAFEPAIFEACRSIEPAETGEYELADAITWLVDRGHAVGVHRHEGERVNVNVPDDVERAARLVDDA